MIFSPFMRQVLVAVTPQLGALSLGGSIGFTCILLQQFKSEEESIRPNIHTVTWIASMHGIAGIGAIFMPVIMQKIGRKLTFIGSCLLLITGWILGATATNAYTILLAEAFLGLGSNCTVIVNLITVSEMLAPKYRTISMMLLGISQSLGMVLVSSVGALIHWKKVALIMCSPVILALVMISFGPESPAWLAYKKKFDKCEKAFIWLRGTEDEEAKKELETLIAAQREVGIEMTKKSTLQEVYLQIKMKDFYRPSFHMFIILFNFYVCGGVCLVIYSKDVMIAATGNEEASFYGFLFINFTFFFGAIFSLFIIRYFSGKKILYIGGICNIFLLAASLVSYLQNIGVISRDSLMFIYFFLGYTVFCNSGLNTISFAIPVEIMPVKHRGIGGICFNIITCLLHFTSVKLLPYMMMYMGIPITFLLFSLSSISCTLFIWKYVPETKGRTLQEMEDYYNYGSCIKLRDLEDSKDVNMPIVKTNI